MITGQDLVDKAREYVGLPYLDKGRSKRTGVDCVGLLVAVARDLGIELNDRFDYNQVPDPAVLLQGLLDNCERTQGKCFDAGVIGLMQFDKQVGPTHTVLFTGNGIIHSHNRGQKKVLEHSIDNAWKRRIVGTFKLKGVSYE